MLKKTSFYVVCMAVGVILIGAVFIIKGETLKAVSGVCLGVGSGLLGMAVSNLLIKRYEKRHPNIMKQNKIEFKDERNQMIRNRAKSKAGDITQWLIIGLVYIMILADMPLWMTGIGIVIFSLYNILAFYYTFKYEKEM